MASPLWRIRAASGALFWVAAVLAAGAQLADPAERRDLRALECLRDYLASRPFPLTLRFPEAVEVSVGDPVYLALPGGALTRAGEVSALLSGDGVLPALHALPGSGVREVECLLRSAGPPGTPRAKLLSVPQTSSWVLRTLLPPQKLAVLAAEWNQTLFHHREEIFAVLSPVLREALGDLEEVLVEDLPAAIDARRAELGAIGERLQEEVVRGEFLPLIRTELWPIIQRRARPTLDAIGREMWGRLPFWSLAWRLLYQRLPMARQGVLWDEAERFWREETIPILRQHAEDFLLIVQDIVKEGADNPRVSAAFRRSFERLLHDRALQHQARLIFQDVILDNPRFHERMARRWATPAVARALEVLSQRLDPFVRRVGDLILGTRGGGITPELARVLRTQILEKDRRWVLVEFDPLPAGSPANAGAGLLPGTVVPAVVERR